MLQLYIILGILSLATILVVIEIIQIYLATKKHSFIGKRHLNEHLIVLLSFVLFMIMQHIAIYQYFNGQILEYLANEEGFSSFVTATYLLFLSFVKMFVKHLEKERTFGERGFNETKNV